MPGFLGGTLYDVFYLAEGDSITLGSDIAPAPAYPSSIAALHAAWGFATTATDGAWMANLESRASTLDAYVNHDRSHNLLTVMVGRNDWGGGESPNPTAFLERLKAYCLARRAAGWTVVVLSILPGHESGFNVWRNTANASIAGDPSYYDAFVDFTGETWFSDAAGGNATYYPDGIHPTAAVEDAIAVLVNAVLVALAGA